ncbi:MAG: adenosylmethionine--8-amino-7-oxononanoate transaminase [Candidatus Nitrosocaldaceae archaeon]
MNLEELDKKYIWHPYTQMRDALLSKIRVIERAEGFYLIDSEGNRYIDGVASMWCNVWGHGKREIIDAIKEEIDRLQHSSLFGLSNDKAIILAEKLCKLTYMDKVFYSGDGSSAVEVALKMALQYWINNKEKRKKVISLKNGYHGDTIGTMSIGYIEDFFSNYKQLLFDVKQITPPYIHRRVEMSDEDYINHCIDVIERELKDEPICLIMESGAQVAGGALIYPKGYQSRVSKLCREYDTLFILDEIATGFGRLGNMIEFIAQDSRPDIVTFGKMLTAGYLPLAATLTTEKIFNAFLGEYHEHKQLYHGHTFTGNPLACVAALSNLDLYEKYNLIEDVRRKERIIASRLEEFKSDIIEEIRHKGMMIGIQLKNIRVGKAINYLIMEEGFKRGAYIRPLGNVMMLMPPLSIDDCVLEKLLDIAYNIIRDIEKEV